MYKAENNPNLSDYHQHMLTSLQNKEYLIKWWVWVRSAGDGIGLLLRWHNICLWYDVKHRIGVLNIVNWNLYVKHSGCKIIVILVLQRWRVQLRSTAVTVIADYFSLHKDHVIRASLNWSERRISGTTYIVLKMSQFFNCFWYSFELF